MVFSSETGLESLRRQYAQTPERSAALDRIEKAYSAAVNHESSAIDAELVYTTAPKEVTRFVPKLGGVLKAKQELSDAIRQTGTAFQ